MLIDVAVMLPARSDAANTDALPTSSKVSARLSMVAAARPSVIISRHSPWMVSGTPALSIVSTRMPFGPSSRAS